MPVATATARHFCPWQTDARPPRASTSFFSASMLNRSWDIMGARNIFPSLSKMLFTFHSKSSWGSTSASFLFLDDAGFTSFLGASCLLGEAMGFWV
eukprot:CAMPEP_0113868766 /NCGR_PEP_ID=MMETSP0780_2-20120614/1171_1 /TAXON_ID=652834 /ORGANISM="Palpitomonas bilix" /LENGTH=95 /DNA_ID=CAMNT_0000853885 /DNA_START=480 /DNA_END=767 /DNA_ORIENTATION=- /assembly_acc=CAM_ASM_000599